MFILLCSGFSFAQKDKTPSITRILFIFDESKSMLGTWENGVKIEVAKKWMNKLLDSLATLEDVEIALRLYGHQFAVPPQVCTDTRLEVPFGKNNANEIKKILNETVPKGTTPIAYSLEQCGNDFPICKNCRNIVILITDGIEACEGDPCKVSQALQSKNIFLRPFVIGLGLDIEAVDAFKCIGQYFNADSEKKFQQVLNTVVTQAVGASKTTCQVNLNDTQGQPTETNVSMTFYDKATGKIVDNFMHTINTWKLPDTIYLNPAITYKILVHTVPPVIIDNVKLIPLKHTTIKANTPQGTLIIKETQTQKYKDAKIIVRKQNDLQILTIQEFEKTEKYITGKYDLEILTLPRLNYKGIEIKQSETTTITIPQPGLATISVPADGYADLFVKNGDKVELLYTLDHISSISLTLLPGIYMVVYRSENMKHTSNTLTKEFELKQGYSIFVKMDKY
jgi:Ca-activated chloride channel family protein